MMGQLISSYLFCIQFLLLIQFQTSGSLYGSPSVCGLWAYEDENGNLLINNRSIVSVSTLQELFF